MESGKRICNTLKELRKRIADANDIPFELEECSYDGICSGTCPKCEDELNYLKNALSEREKKGLSIKLEGLMCEEELHSTVSSSKLSPLKDTALLRTLIHGNSKFKLEESEISKCLQGLVIF